MVPPAAVMLARLGFVASVLTEGISTSRTCRLANASDARLRELIDLNLSALDRVVSFLGSHRIRLYRISSNLIPYGSHPVHTTPWWEDHASRLSALGARIRRAGVRVSTHPGQYTVLNSPHDSIVRASIDELIYHARLLDAFGTDTSCKIVLHVGGIYGGSASAAMDRFITRANALPLAVRRRLVVENDDRIFDAEDALYVAREVGIPVIFDWLHHQANPCHRPLPEVLDEIFSTWTPADGRPKVHLSSQARGARAGAHAPFVAVRDFLDMGKALPASAFDCMLEAKQKDRALLRLRRELIACGIRESDVELRALSVDRAAIGGAAPAFGRRKR